MTFIDLKLELPDRLAREAKEAGLLSPRKLAQIIRAEIRRQAAVDLVTGANKAKKAGSIAMSMRDIQEIVNEVRSEQRTNRR